MSHTTMNINVGRIKVGKNAILAADRVQRGGTTSDNSFFEGKNRHTCDMNINIGHGEIHGVAAAKNVKLMRKEHEHDRFQDQGPMFYTPEDHFNSGEPSSQQVGGTTINLKMKSAYVSPTGVIAADKYQRNGDLNDDSFLETATDAEINVDIGGGHIEGVVGAENIIASD